MKQKINYRSDIDGLRAIAVIGVILYHSEINIGDNLIFSGGFLGVDVFFVISGYLITSIILKEHLIKNHFSFLNFYKRRVRRLVPALLFVLLASFILAYVILLPIQFKSFLNSILSSIFFILISIFITQDKHMDKQFYQASHYFIHGLYQ